MEQLSKERKGGGGRRGSLFGREHGRFDRA